MHEVNNPYKLIFRIFTDQITTHNNISLIHAGSMAVVKKNSNFNLNTKRLGKIVSQLNLFFMHINFL